MTLLIFTIIIGYMISDLVTEVGKSRKRRQEAILNRKKGEE